MILRAQHRARLTLLVCFRSRRKHNRSRHDHVTAYREVHGAFATLVVTCSTRHYIKYEIKVTLHRASSLFDY